MSASNNAVKAPFSSSWLEDAAIPVYGTLTVGAAALLLSESEPPFAARRLAVALCIGGLFSWLCGRWMPSPRGMTGVALSMLPVLVSFCVFFHLDSLAFWADADGRDLAGVNYALWANRYSLARVAVLGGQAALLGATSFLWRALWCEKKLPCRDSADHLAFQAGIWLLFAGALAFAGAWKRHVLGHYDFHEGAWSLPVQVLDAIVGLAGAGLALVTYRRIHRQRKWVAEVLVGTNERWEIHTESGPTSADRLLAGAGAIAEEFTMIVQERREDRGLYRGSPETEDVVGALPSNATTVISQVPRGLARSLSMLLLVVVCALCSYCVFNVLWYWFRRLAYPVALLLYGVPVGSCYCFDRVREEMRRP